MPPNPRPRQNAKSHWHGEGAGEAPRRSAWIQALERRYRIDRQTVPRFLLRSPRIPEATASILDQRRFREVLPTPCRRWLASWLELLDHNRSVRPTKSERVREDGAQRHR